MSNRILLSLSLTLNHVITLPYNDLLWEVCPRCLSLAMSSSGRQIGRKDFDTSRKSQSITQLKRSLLCLVVSKEYREFIGNVTQTGK